MKRLALLVLAALWLAAPTDSFAQSVTKLCFPATGLTATRTSCIPVDNNNPLPTSASISLGSSINVTPNNVAASPLFVSSPNGFGGATSGAVSATITNTTAGPVFVSTPNGFGGAVSGTLTVQNLAAGSSLNVLDTNSAAILTMLGNINTTAGNPLAAGTAQIGTVTVQNSNASNPVFTQTVPGTANGWQTALLNGLTTTVTTVKNGAAKFGKLYCYNPNSSVTYVQVFNATPSNITLGTTTPANSYGIAATSIGGFGSSIGDGFSAALSVAATTTVKGLTAPSTAIDCNVSYN